MDVRRFSKHRPEPLEQQPESGLAQRGGSGAPAEPSGGGVERGAKGTAVETAPRLVIEILGGDLHPWDRVLRPLYSVSPRPQRTRLSVANS